LLNQIAALHAGGAAAGGGTSYESIATYVATGNVTSITFSSIPSTYKHLQIRGSLLCTNQQNILTQVNSDTAGNYSWHELYGQGSSAGAGAGTSASFMQIGFVESNSTSYTGGFVADFLDYADTNKYKTMRSLLGSDANGSGYILLRSGSWRSTSAINTIKIYPASTDAFKQYSHIGLYGIKG
jgi:hypothetical protein